MRKLAAIITLALIVSSCTGSRGCGCPSFGMVPGLQDNSNLLVQYSNDLNTELSGIEQDFVWQ